MIFLKICPTCLSVELLHEDPLDVADLVKGRAEHPVFPHHQPRLQSTRQAHPRLPLEHVRDRHPKR